ncbi:hypothetical protein SAMN06265355_12748 [Actinomadura mexicana]|uniref:Pentapeptide repeat-containing protein n=1 Tax=Actinomadura mexicana TaxID=134959 RepID=A0A239H161_9ACTN|nr:hypothetical protein SAMN06265355_12748 [Actinomadura mexicana]
MVDFGNARFLGGTILFSGARFVNRAVSFDSAAGRRPAGLPHGMADHLSQ